CQIPTPREPTPKCHCQSWELGVGITDRVWELTSVSLPESLTRLVEQLQKLPGIGAKSAQRLAFHILRHPREDAEQLCNAIRDVKERVTYCYTCHHITDRKSVVSGQSV